MKNKEVYILLQTKLIAYEKKMRNAWHKVVTYTGIFQGYLLTKQKNKDL